VSTVAVATSQLRGASDPRPILIYLTVLPSLIFRRE